MLFSFDFLIITFPYMYLCTAIFTFIFYICETICSIHLNVFNSIPSVFYFIQTKTAITAFSGIQMYIASFLATVIYIPTIICIFFQCNK